MDSDLAESVSALKAIFERRRLHVEFGKADASLVDELRKGLRVPSRFRAFLLEANPRQVETVTPVERVRLFPAEEFLSEQRGFALLDDGSPRTENKDGSWRRSWVLIGRSSLLGDPYFLDVSKLDPEGDCPVYTAMSGTERWEPRLCASSFAQFLRILTTAMEIAQGFGEAILDDEDEASFREALGAKLKAIDAAALRAGHWTLPRAAGQPFWCGRKLRFFAAAGLRHSRSQSLACGRTRTAARSVECPDAYPPLLRHALRSYLVGDGPHPCRQSSSPVGRKASSVAGRPHGVSRACRRPVRSKRRSAARSAAVAFFFNRGASLA